ncbi:MAG: heavy metal-associated domain-containing protein [Candidatus Pacebacteria bacterium]|nr:heavy metal-associated domain-containing protein [Candidatus Paceibacterota bacterium]
MLKLSVEGMHCGGCAASVEKSLRTVAGVSSVTVDLAQKTAVVDGAGITPSALIAALATAGFEARVG